MANSSVNQKEAENFKVLSFIQSILGWIIALFFGPVALIGLTQLTGVPDFIIMLILATFTALGIRLAVLGKKKRKLLAKFQDYSVRLAQDPDKSLVRLAAEINAPSDEITKDVSEMISAGLFPNCYIDIKSGCLISPEPFSKTVTGNQQKKNTARVTVKCKNCGAPNTVTEGSVTECEFCGSQISSK